MTAEIAILNKSAVALAADSKVTVTAGAQSKGYDSANKVFTLSKIHPVGIMVFGNAEFMRFPWETVIKIYRDKKRDKSERLVQDWANDFINFISCFGNITDADKANNIESVLISWFGSIERLCLARAQEMNIAAPSIEFAEMLKSDLKQRASEIQESKFLLSEEDFKVIAEKYKDPIVSAVHSFFKTADDQGFFDVAVEFSVAVLCGDIFSPQSSGFVVAGFGDDEYFPTLFEYMTDGYIGDTIKLKLASESDLTREMSSAIHAFAQRDMVQRFMTGVDPSLFQTLQSVFANSLLDSCMSVLNEYGSEENKSDEVKQEITKAVAARVQSVVSDSNSYLSAKFAKPVVDMVAVLPKDELAHLAESLVALTSLQRRISSDVETVGGPVDVALISKGDGFVWVKRKHYFKPELNQHFFSNYMRSVHVQED